MSKLISHDSIVKDVTRGSRTYLAARSTYAAFAPYETATALLDALVPTSPLGFEERDALIVAIVTENQRAPHHVWQSLLLGAFERLLVRLRLFMGKREDFDLDQRVLLAFLEAVRAVRVGQYTILAIRWATEGALKDQRRREARAPKCVVFNEEKHSYDPFGPSAEVKAAAEEIVRMLEAREGQELLDAVLATHTADESLQEYVDRTYAGVSREARASAYERLKVGRQRVVTELRARLAPRERAA